MANIFCSSCGYESAPGLQFCKRCGANLAAAAPLVVASRPPGLFWLILFVIAMFGIPIPILAITFEMINLLVVKGARNGILILIAMVSLVVTASTVTILGRVLNKLIDAYLHPVGRVEQRVEQRRVAPAVDHVQLATPPDSVVSVTEHTTRTLSPKLTARD
jgi:hypothetical protein